MSCDVILKYSAASEILALSEGVGVICLIDSFYDYDRYCL